MSVSVIVVDMVSVLLMCFMRFFVVVVEEVFEELLVYMETVNVENG